MKLGGCDGLVVVIIDHTITIESNGEGRIYCLVLFVVVVNLRRDRSNFLRGSRSKTIVRHVVHN